MKEKVYRIISDVFEIERTEITEDFSKNNCEKWDSIMHLSLIAELENEFDISFEPEEIEAIDSIKKLMETLSMKGFK